MKTKTQKNNYRMARRQTHGFTLLEMIGVLAVIAILAAVLLPKVFSAIDNARVSNAAMTCNTIKTAIIDHYSKFGSLTAGLSTTTPQTFAVPSGQYDTNLVQEQVLDKLFATKIGDGTANTTIELDTADTTNQAPTAGAFLLTGSLTHTLGQASFNLDGTTVAANINQATGSAVVYAVITGVNLNDARALNALIDGNSPTLGEGGQGGNTADATATDLCGRVKYQFTAAGQPTTVYIYLTHR